MSFIEEEMKKKLQEKYKHSNIEREIANKIVEKCKERIAESIRNGKKEYRGYVSHGSETGAKIHELNGTLEEYMEGAGGFCYFNELFSMWTENTIMCIIRDYEREREVDLKSVKDNLKNSLLGLGCRTVRVEAMKCTSMTKTYVHTTFGDTKRINKVTKDLEHPKYKICIDVKW